MDIAIEVANLTKVYPGGLRAVDDVNFSVRRGEIFGLLGVNGAGKTTLIKVITTLLKPTSGSVKVLGMDVQHHPVEVKKRLGVVPQENNLDVRLTVRQNLIFHCKYFGMRKREYTGEIERWMRLLGLKDKGDETVYHLSGGTKRKVMVAKAFITNPAILILDEPTSGLDPQVRSLVWERIRDFRGNGRTALLSTHHLEEAEGLCDRIGIIHMGRLLFIGSPEGLKEEALRKGGHAVRMDDAFHIAIGVMV